MKFGNVAVADAEGAVLAHAVKAGELRYPKGYRLDREDVGKLDAAGMTHVIAARLDPGDLSEDEAASRIAAAIPVDHLTIAPASTGRVNIFSAVNGLFRANRDIVDRLNRVDPAITLACLKDCADVRAGDMVATIKIIPLAVAGEKVAEAEDLLRAYSAFEVKPYRPCNVALIATELPSLKASVMEKTRKLLEARLVPSGSRLTIERRVAHEAMAVAEAIRREISGNNMIVVFGASAVADFDDVIPQAIRFAGGVVERVGLPVDPGNLLVLGRVGDVRVIGAPGCARSPKENAFDWVLSRVFAGDPPSESDLAGWGVGGLLMEIPSRPQPRLTAGKQARPLHVAAVILAAGQARRMGGSHHKLLAEFQGIPLIRKSVETVLASGIDSAVVVTGHRAREVAGAVAGTGCPVIDNPAFATGMASSLKVGLGVVRGRADGLLVMLADMPGIVPADLDCLVGVFREQAGQAIVRAVCNGKRGNPVILPRSTFESIMRLEGDIGARPIIEESDLRTIDVEIGPAAHLDTDTPEAIVAAGGVLKD